MASASIPRVFRASVFAFIVGDDQAHFVVSGVSPFLAELLLPTTQGRIERLIVFRRFVDNDLCASDLFALVSLS
jgi:hypothetical protein